MGADNMTSRLSEQAAFSCRRSEPKRSLVHFTQEIADEGRVTQ
jgi:hypothetical protein